MYVLGGQRPAQDLLQVNKLFVCLLACACLLVCLFACLLTHELCPSMVCDAVYPNFTCIPVIEYRFFILMNQYY